MFLKIVEWAVAPNKMRVQFVKYKSCGPKDSYSIDFSFAFRFNKLHQFFCSENQGRNFTMHLE